MKGHDGLRNFWIRGPPGKSSNITFLTQRSDFQSRFYSLCLSVFWAGLNQELQKHEDGECGVYTLTLENRLDYIFSGRKHRLWPQFEGRGQREEAAWWQSRGFVYTCCPEFEVPPEVVDNGKTPKENQTGISEHLKGTHGHWTGNASVSALASPKNRNEAKLCEEGWIITLQEVFWGSGLRRWIPLVNLTAIPCLPAF